MACSDVLGIPLEEGPACARARMRPWFRETGGADDGVSVREHVLVRDTRGRGGLGAGASAPARGRGGRNECHKQRGRGGRVLHRPLDHRSEHIAGETAEVAGTMRTAGMGSQPRV